VNWPAYDSYRGTGEQWLGNIPEHWELRPLGFHFTERKTTVSDVDYPPLSVTMGGIVPQLETAAKTDNPENRKLVLAGDFVINSRSDRKGSAGISDRDGSVSVISTVLEPRDIEIDFVHHLLRSRAFQEEYYRFGSGIVADLWSTRYSAMKQITLAVPPRNEQRAIARFLDRETTKIDALIAKQEQLIATLREDRAATITQAVTKGLDPNVEMKNSGIEWIGEIPVDWQVRQIKWGSPVKRGASPRPIDDPKYFDDEGEWSWVRIADVSASGGRLRETTQRLSTLGSSLSVKISPGSLFISIAGTVGKPCITEIPACIHDGFVYFPTLDLNPEYLYRIFEAGECYKGLGKMGTQLNLNTDTIGSIHVPFPPSEEQRRIVHGLNERCATIDKLIGKSTEMIETLREYRSALITDAVTGKIDVRGVA